jgi:hypothetical protein
LIGSFGSLLVIGLDGAHESLLLLHVFRLYIDVNLSVSAEKRHVIRLIGLFDRRSLAELALTRRMLQS